MRSPGGRSTSVWATPCDPREYGCADAPDIDVLVLIAGFPDSHAMWERQLDALGEKFYVLSLVTPDFTSLQPSSKWGYTEEEVVTLIRHAIDDAIGPERPFKLLTHDWGSVWGYALAKALPKRCERFASIDVGAHATEGVAETDGGLVWIALYQLSFAAIFWIGVRLSATLAQFLAALFWRLAPLIGPLGLRFDFVKSMPRPRSEVKWWMAWPYFQTWHSILCRRGQGAPALAFPAMPHFFAYGADKPRCHFHSQSFLQRMARTDGNVVRAYACSHWVMWECAAELNEDLLAFFTAA